MCHLEWNEEGFHEYIRDPEQVRKCVYIIRTCGLGSFLLIFRSFLLVGYIYVFYIYIYTQVHFLHLQDFPSIHQVQQKLIENDIVTILAVTMAVLDLYTVSGIICTCVYIQPE